MRLVWCILFLFVFSYASVGYGQDVTPPGEAAPAPPTTDNEHKTKVSASEKTISNDQQAEIDGLKKEMALMREEFEEKLRASKEETDSRLDEMALADAEEEISFERGLRFSGFVDMNFSKNFPEEGSLMDNEWMLPTKSTFSFQHLNLMLSNDITDTLSFFGEIRFTFLPNGAEAFVDDTNEVIRTSTRVTDPSTLLWFRYGGIGIERAYLKWSPFEFFGIIAGYYLTPYGIWHVDHGSPVRISIQPPFKANTVVMERFRARAPLPDGQLGLQAFGRFFPFRHTNLDYAVTLSNGRGPSDTVMDLDENKGLGLRLRLSYLEDDVELALGSYGYMGDYTDTKKGLDGSGGTVTTVVAFREYVATADLLISVFGLRLQSEYVVMLTKYKAGVPRPAMYGFDQALADHTTDLFFNLLSYRLPIGKWIGDGSSITPYVGMELDIPHDYNSDHKQLIVLFGLNYKPVSSVALKLEGVRAQTFIPEISLEPYVWTLLSQLSVAF